MSDAWISALVALPFGLALGSFMTVVVSRVPAGESVRAPEIAMPALRRRDREPRQHAGDLVGAAARTLPIVRRAASRCGTRCSSSRPPPLVVAAAAAYELPWVAVMMAAFLSLMPAIAWIDIEHRIIPNRITYPAFIAFAVYVVVAWAVRRGHRPGPCAHRRAPLRGRAVRRGDRLAWHGHG